MSLSKFFLFIGILLLPWLILFLIFGGLIKEDTFLKRKKRPYLIEGFFEFLLFVLKLPLLFGINVFYFLFIVLPFATPFLLVILIITNDIELNFLTFLFLCISVIWMLFTYRKLRER